MRKLTDNQRHNAYELLYHRLVRYHGGGPQGCKATVGSRTRPGVQYEVEIGTDTKGVWGRCDCPLQQHRPSWPCSHIGAVMLVWWAVTQGDDSDGQSRQSKQTRRADVSHANGY